MTEPGPSPGAARRYKDITGAMTDAVARMRRADTERAARLGDRLVELDESMGVAADRAALSALAVGLQWDTVLEALWNEHWMTLSPLPKPDPNASAQDLDHLDAVVAKRYEALREAIRRRALLGRR